MRHDARGTDDGVLLEERLEVVGCRGLWGVRACAHRRRTRVAGRTASGKGPPGPPGQSRRAVAEAAL
eukprot:1198455-Alexandrium_andersonii.AAC.1